MSKLLENVSLIQTTMNYFCSSAVFNFLTFKDDFLCLKLYHYRSTFLLLTFFLNFKLEALFLKKETNFFSLKVV